MSAPVEMYFSAGRVALMLDIGEAWVRRNLDKFRDPEADAERDSSVIEVGNEIRISLTAYNRFRASHVKVHAVTVRARNLGAARRQVERQQASGVAADDSFARRSEAFSNG